MLPNFRNFGSPRLTNVLCFRCGALVWVGRYADTSTLCERCRDEAEQEQRERMAEDADYTDEIREGNCP